MKDEQQKTDADRLYDEVSHKASKLTSKTDKTISISDNHIGLCFTCEHSFIYRTARNNDPVVHCCEYVGSTHSTLRPNDIVECNHYEKAGQLNIWDLIKSCEGKIPDLSISTKKVGFQGN